MTNENGKANLLIEECFSTHNEKPIVQESSDGDSFEPYILPQNEVIGEVLRAFVAYSLMMTYGNFFEVIFLSSTRLDG